MRLPRSRARLVRPLATVGAVVALAASAGCGGGDDTTASDPGSSPSASAGSGPSCTYTETGDASAPAELPPEQATVTGSTTATIDTSVGAITATLDGEAAPCTVNSFVSLAGQGFFDGTTCHRLTTSPQLQVLQCGDPTGTGRGGPGYSFPDELTGQETYGAGTLAMANAGPDTNGSQFFIVYGDSQLTPDYTVFGSIDEDSIAVVQQVAAAGAVGGTGDGAPATPVDITSVTIGD